MTIHHEHPFEDPLAARDVVRQFRGRLAAGVSLWTAGEGQRRAGLTVSSLLVASGTPPALLALIDPLSELADELQRAGRAAVTLLRRDEADLAEVFAGRAPAPGGMFAQAAFDDTRWGPVLPGERSWAGVSLSAVAQVGWALLVTCTLDEVSLAGEDDPLAHFRGRYRGLA